MKTSASIALVLIASAAFAAPPGAPMSDFGPQQVAVSLFYDHSGQDLYSEMAPSLMNSTGLSADYAPWPYLQLGIYAGADEFDVGVPETWVADTSKHGFNSDYQLLMGGTAKLASPRFISNRVRLVIYGGAGYFKNSDDPGNERKGFTYNAGGSVQVAAWRGLNVVLGGEFYAIDGEQKDAQGRKQPFGLTALDPVDFTRGLVGLEYYFTGKNRPFISVSFRPSRSIGWDDRLGIRNGSICVSLGAIATLPGKGRDKAEDEGPSGLDE